MIPNDRPGLDGGEEEGEGGSQRVRGSWRVGVSESSWSGVDVEVTIIAEYCSRGGIEGIRSQI